MAYRAMVPALLSLGLLLGAAAQDSPKTVKEVMAVGHKGKDSLLTKVLGGKSTDDENKKLVAYYEVLAAIAKPPQGDEKSWKDKTTALLGAAKEVAEKKAGAVDKLKAASDCKACHSLHKPK